MKFGTLKKGALIGSRGMLADDELELKRIMSPKFAEGFPLSSDIKYKLNLKVISGVLEIYKLEKRHF